CLIKGLALLWLFSTSVVAIASTSSSNGRTISSSPSCHMTNVPFSCRRWVFIQGEWLAGPDIIYEGKPLFIATNAPSQRSPEKLSSVQLLNDCQVVCA